MKLYVHRFITTVVTADPNAESVQTTVDGALQNHRTDHPKGTIFTSDTVAVAEAPREWEVPDEPFNGHPDNDIEISEHDGWVNRYIYNAMEMAKVR